jgi:ABC-type sugar transport system ATPase subunit
MIEQGGSPLEIYSTPVSYYVADFFGSPSMNLVAGEVVRDGDAARFLAPRFTLTLPDRFNGVAPGPATLGMRPEHMTARAGEGDGDVQLPVSLVEPLGKDTLLYFDDGTPRSLVAVSEGLSMAQVKVGTPIALSFDPKQLFLFGPDGRRIAAAG